jgi:hypothetical protein
MRVEAVAVGTKSSAAGVAVYGRGPQVEAVAALIGLRGHRVALLGTERGIAKKCDITTENNVRYTTAFAAESAAALGSVKNVEVIVVSCPATSYGEVFEDLLPHFVSGQTIFLMGAAIGAALEVDMLLRSRKDLSVNLIEVSHPFARVKVDASSVSISGARDTLVISGRSLNETRNGLSAGGGIFNGLVPASNLLERAFFDIDKWMDVAAMLFAIVGTQPNASVVAVLSALRTELQLLGKAYGHNRVPEPNCSRIVGAPDAAAFADGIIDDFIILSSLARLEYVPVPILDSLIELGTAITRIDLRKEGRQLTNLGLIGMDAQEILEHISA